ncbi:MAG: 23S rRNA pseudouridine(2604) synthase RluF [Lachnospiraceae bacterium]|nr:23S rRNA pseudouridine(2604) synthase RluF [Lachnospiraceae bacterium]
MKNNNSKLKKDLIEKFDESSQIRLNKFMSDAGFCSRREADRLIEAGEVLVDGKAAVMGQKIFVSQKVECRGKVIKRDEELILLALNKPVGIECTTDETNPDNIVDFVGYPKRIYPVGRLDKNSEGLILLTNDGAIVNKILKAVNYHEKEYVVRVNKPITDDFIKKMSSGVKILDTITRKCKVTKVNKDTFNIVLTQGLNRQIRRMCEALGYKVLKLKRIRIINILLDNIPVGKYKEIKKSELEELLRLVNK